MRNGLILLIMMFLLCFTFPAIAQEGSISSGGDVSSTSGKMSYSLGQVFYSTYSGTDASIVHGIQQPHVAIHVVSIKDAPKLKLDMKVYPNPAGKVIYLEKENDPDRNLMYFLYDMNGQMLESGSLVSDVTHVSMADYTPSIYLLSIKEYNIEVISFKICKTR